MILRKQVTKTYALTERYITVKICTIPKVWISFMHDGWMIIGYKSTPNLTDSFIYYQVKHGFIHEKSSTDQSSGKVDVPN